MSVSRNLYHWIPCILSLAVLAAGFAFSGVWTWAALLIIPGLAFGLAFQPGASWLGTAGLISSVLLAAAGALTGAAGELMIVGAAFALAGWDLINYERSLRGKQTVYNAYRLDRLHLRYLVIAIGLGAGLAVFGKLLAIQIPFLVMILIVALSLFSLDRILSFRKQKD